MRAQEQNLSWIVVPLNKNMRDDDAPNSAGSRLTAVAASATCETASAIWPVGTATAAPGQVTSNNTVAWW